MIGIENASNLTPEAYQNISETLNSFNPGALIRDDDTAALQTVNFGRATPEYSPCNRVLVLFEASLNAALEFILKM